MNNYPNELYHHGIKNQKWGVRRFQNEDGSLTPEGRKRYGVKEYKAERAKLRMEGENRSKAAKRITEVNNEMDRLRKTITSIMTMAVVAELRPIKKQDVNTLAFNQNWTIWRLISIMPELRMRIESSSPSMERKRLTSLVKRPIAKRWMPSSEGWSVAPYW